MGHWRDANMSQNARIGLFDDDPGRVGTTWRVLQVGRRGKN